MAQQDSPLPHTKTVVYGMRHVLCHPLCHALLSIRVDVGARDSLSEDSLYEDSL